MVPITQVPAKVISLSAKQALYRDTLQKTLLAELEFLMHVVQGRIPD